MITSVAFVLAALTTGVAPETDATVALTRIGNPQPATGVLESECDSGIVYDDGTFDSAIRPVSEHRSNLVMRLDPVVLERLDRVCLCWSASTSAGVADLAHSLRVWAADGPGGRPGTLLAELPGLNISAPASPPPVGTRTFFTYDLAPLDFSFATPVYVGPSWYPAEHPELSLCFDSNPDTPLRRTFIGTDPTGEALPPTVELGTGVHSDLRALGIRAITSPLGDAPHCTATATSLCLVDSRFRVDVSWDTGQAIGNGSTRIIPEVDFSGLFWFFNPSNLEMIVKVLDGCALNGHFWVFYAATTNVGFELEVTDMANATTKTYSNPLGQAAEPIQDSQAFPCSP